MLRHYEEYDLDRYCRVGARASDEASPYFHATKRTERMVERMLAKSTADTAEVATVIADAAIANEPRLRYLVGADAKRRAMLKSILARASSSNCCSSLPATVGEFLVLRCADEVRALLGALSAAGAERVALTEVDGCVLAAAVTAPEDFPAWPVAVMDVFAVRARDTFGMSDAVQI